MKKNILKKLGIILVLSLTISVLPVVPVSAAETTALPSSYDARNYGYITEKKVQYGGSCWVFAATATAEASLVKSGLADRSIDLSELHSVYYAYTSAYNDPLGNTEGDCGLGTDIYTILNTGGQGQYVAEQFAKWSGPVAEAEIPYNIDEYRQDVTDGTWPEITTDLSAESLYHLKKAIYADHENRDEIKKLIMEYGSVTGAYYVGSSVYANYKDYEEATYHIPNTSVSNHAISIIGWDDNYPKENFNVQPENNGAWLIKNNDGSNQKWMWISYETYMHDITAFEFESAELLENNYQYDGHCGSQDTFNAIVGSSRPQVKSCINVFEAKRSQNALEKLEAVMIHGSRNKKSQITIYVNPVIKNGQLISYEYKSSTFEFCPEYGGIYKVDVPEDIYLNTGDTFGIEITGEGIEKYSISTSSPYGIDAVHPGESYVGKMEDGEFSYVDLADYSNSGNLRIKGFTNSTDIPLAGDVSIDKTSAQLKPGEGFKLNGSVQVPKGAMGGITYTSSNPSVATVDENGNVKAVGVGNATITVAATYGADRKECTVEVMSKLAESLTVEGSVSIGINEEYQLNPVVNADATNKNVTYESSAEWVVSVDENGLLYGLSSGTATITVRTTDGSNLSAVCTVRVKAPWESDEVFIPDTSNIPNTTFTELIVIGLTNDHIQVGGTTQLLVDKYPATATGQLQYSVSDPTVISLNGNLITGLKPGKAVITVTASDSKISNSITVNVDAPVTAPAPKPEVIKTGTAFVYNGLKYTVTSKNTVKITGAKKSSITSVSIPATVKYNKKTFNVTEIGSKAFYGYKKLQTVTIGKNVKTIGKNAFNGCKKLQTIKVNSKVLKTVGKNAFKGIKSNAKITVPKSKYSTYKKKVFKSAGLGSKVTWKKK